MRNGAFSAICGCKRTIPARVISSPALLSLITGSRRWPQLSMSINNWTSYFPPKFVQKEKDFKFYDAVWLHGAGLDCCPVQLSIWRFLRTYVTRHFYEIWIHLLFALLWQRAVLSTCGLWINTGSLLMHIYSLVKASKACLCVLSHWYLSCKKHYRYGRVLALINKYCLYLMKVFPIRQLMIKTT